MSKTTAIAISEAGLIKLQNKLVVDSHGGRAKREANTSTSAEPRRNSCSGAHRDGYQQRGCRSFFSAMASADLSKKPENGATRYKFKSPEQSAEERRSAFESWIFSKAFQDLMRGVRGSLEQTYFFQELSKIKEVESDITLDDLLAPLYNRASDLSFPDLLEKVNARLKEPLNFSDAFNSLQKARNCFEHRAGIVGKKDISTLSQKLPCLTYGVQSRWLNEATFSDAKDVLSSRWTRG